VEAICCGGGIVVVAVAVAWMGGGPVVEAVSVAWRGDSIVVVEAVAWRDGGGSGIVVEAVVVEESVAWRAGSSSGIVVEALLWKLLLGGLVVAAALLWKLWAVVVLLRKLLGVGRALLPLLLGTALVVVEDVAWRAGGSSGIVVEALGSFVVVVEAIRGREGIVVEAIAVAVVIQKIGIGVVHHQGWCW
jgi:hypothetical protein